MPRIDARFVILNEVKNPLKADKRQRTQRIASEEILRFTQDDKQYVILNEVKNPLEAVKRQRTQCIASEEILRVAQDDILSARCPTPCNDGDSALQWCIDAKKSADPRAGTHAYYIERL